MKKMCRVALVFGLASLLAAPALAQRQRGNRQGPQGFGGGGELFLLTQESVQKDLKLSEEQVKKVQDLQAKQREARQGLRDLSQEERRTKMQEQAKESQKALKEVLDARQQTRLHQIGLQREGARALSRKDVAETLALSDEQKEKIKTIQEEARKEMGELRGAGNNEDNRKKFAEIRKNTEEKVMGVLSAEQKTKLEKMKGEPFKGEIRMQQRGGNRGRGGRQDR